MFLVQISFGRSGTRRRGRSRTEPQVTLPKGTCTRRHTYTRTYTLRHTHPYTITNTHTHTHTHTHTQDPLRAAVQKEESKPQEESRPRDTQVSFRKLVPSPQELPKVDGHCHSQGKVLGFSHDFLTSLRARKQKSPERGRCALGSPPVGWGGIYKYPNPNHDSPAAARTASSHGSRGAPAAHTLGPTGHAPCAFSSPHPRGLRRSRGFPKGRSGGGLVRVIIRNFRLMQTDHFRVPEG